MKYDKIFIAVVSGIIIVLSGCGHNSSNMATVTSTATPTATISYAASPDPVSTNREQQILQSTISAMTNINSFGMNSDVTYSYNTVFDDKEIYKGIVRWKGERLVDISTKQLHLNMSIDQGYFPNNVGCPLETDIYYDKGYAYQQSFTCYGGNTQGKWQKWRLAEEMWDNQIQLSLLLGLLNSSNPTISLGSEIINGQDCFVMGITPSAEAIADWVLSQSQQGIGPNIGLSSSPSIVGKEMFVQTYKGGIFQIWITKGNYFIIQAKLAPHFEATPDELSKFFGRQVSQKSTVDVLGLMSFSNYNQPVSIQLPQEALIEK